MKNHPIGPAPRAISFASLLLAALACGSQIPGPSLKQPEISAAAILEHVEILASDEFEGRAPGTKGEESFRAATSATRSARHCQ